LATFVGVGLVTVAYYSWLHITDATVAALTYLLLVLFVATFSRLWVALATSALALNFFFLPPIGTLNIDEPQDWAAFLAFIAVSVVASHLSSIGRAREDELRRLFLFSRDALVEADAHPFRALATHLLERFRLEYVGIFLPNDGGFDRHEGGTGAPRVMPALAELRRIANGSIDDADKVSIIAPNVFVFAAEERRPVWFTPLPRGTETIGLLAIAGRRLENATLNAVASVVAIAVERARLLEQRQQAETARRSVDIKSVLLTSFAHDLRTPLTVARTAVSNLGVPSLTDAQRARQVDIALTGLDRLARLFQNILEMARLDTGAVTPSLRWVHASEVIQAARKQVEPALREHELAIVDRSSNQVVHVDPRLLSTAVAHLLENAAQYSPPGSTITVIREIVSGGVCFSVEDQGEGIEPQDLPRLFERFYRGSRAGRHPSGTGMGLAIVRGLLSAQNGRVWVEHREGGGTRFSLFVPAETRTPTDNDREPAIPV
jgi:two-component system sensor histidine kinase KdpD